jgi:RHH-type proline utilization regulon transcriptional repressor/proline dehydrogenase/delta 1-pyrroline-5-carboxylate dehydrogenase
VRSSTSGIKFDQATKERIKLAAASLDRTPHWFMKKAVQYWLAKVEEGLGVSEMLNETDIDFDDRLHSVLGKEKALRVD